MANAHFAGHLQHKQSSSRWNDVLAKQNTKKEIKHYPGKHTYTKKK